MGDRQLLKTIGWVMLGIGTVAAVTALVARDQMARHSRDLFSPHPLRRLAALGYLAGREATVEAVQVLRDFVAWETRPLIRNRAAQILQRMERRLQQRVPAPGEVAG
ncbi:MAG TPA: hypothetical protein VMK65_06130 [Longimicrobiales bacterium]|nr:hypothetical protein [Longimicrobiales bacterium]